MVEPTIPTRAGVRRPDIVLYKGTGPACMIDTQVVADNADLSVSHHRKCDYYNQVEITSWVHHQMGRSILYTRASRCRGVASCLARVQTVYLRQWGSVKSPSPSSLR